MRKLTAHDRKASCADRAKPDEKKGNSMLCANRNAGTVCNPLDLAYRFQVRGWAKECLREAADPSVVFFRDRYWLFASKSGGYWHSADLLAWAFVPTRVLPTEDYAPDVRVIGDAIWFTASRADIPCPVYRSRDPEADQWELLGEVPAHWDPNLFQDDDGRVYLYGGCSDKTPIWGVELDPRTLRDRGERKALIHADTATRGWERCGENNIGDAAPWIEGAWMTKHAGRYYLQYAAPGTPLNIYADGVCVGDAPLGPFVPAAHNPFSLKPGGFITAAGHGSTFQDRFGNGWHISTMRISVKHIFERRIGLFPAGFDADGVLFCNTAFADYPMRIPSGPWDPWRDPFTGWMLLSYRKPVTASTAQPDHPAEFAVNEDIRTFWAAATREAGQWLRVDLGGACRVYAVQINFAEHACSQYEREGEPLRHGFRLEASPDGIAWRTLDDRERSREDTPHAYLELESPVEARFVRLTLLHMPGGGFPAVSGLRVFGNGGGAPPAAVTGLRAARRPADPRTADIAWDPVPGADGYVVHWGIAPDKLYSSWQVLDACRLELNALTAGVPAWVAVEAFNANGRSPRGEATGLRPNPAGKK